MGHTWGEEAKKTSIWLRDRASALTFIAPGIWAATMVNWNFASRKNKHLSIWANFLPFADPDCNTATTASLSLLHRTVEPTHCRPQTAAATNIGSISFAAMEASENSSQFCQATWNHWLSQTAAQPQEPDASLIKFHRSGPAIIFRFRTITEHVSYASKR